MHHANHFYGHAQILSRYAGMSGTPRIWGYVQHGWNIWDGFAVGMTPDYPGMPRFVWSEAVRRRAWSLGRRSACDDRRAVGLSPTTGTALGVAPSMSGAAPSGTLPRMGGPSGTRES